MRPRPHLVLRTPHRALGRLREELAAKGRLHWLEEDCARLAEPSRYRNPPDDAWKRLKGLARLAPASQPIAIALAGWRERIAQERDRPRKWIIDDDALYRIAERAPLTMDCGPNHPKMRALNEQIAALQVPGEPCTRGGLRIRAGGSGLLDFLHLGVDHVVVVGLGASGGIATRCARRGSGTTALDDQIGAVDHRRR